MNKHQDLEQSREAAEGQKVNPHLVGSSLQLFPILYTNQAPKQLLWQQPAAWLLNRETELLFFTKRSFTDAM